MAVTPDLGTATYYSAHVYHCPVADNGTDIDYSAHHNNRVLSDLYLFPYERARLYPGVEILGVEQMESTVSAVIFNYDIFYPVRIRLYYSAKLFPITEKDLVSRSEDSGASVIDRFFFLDEHPDRRFLLSIADIPYYLLSVPNTSPPVQFFNSK
jgi:hypothetical protein